MLMRARAVASMTMTTSGARALCGRRMNAVSTCGMTTTTTTTRGRYHSRGARTTTRGSTAETDEWISTLEVMSAGAILVPHPDKAAKGGEDSCFVLKQSGAFGVFDGVGGWAEEGVDPAEYSEKFAEKSAESAMRGTRDPVQIMTDAHASTQVIGSCTACIAVLQNGGVLEIANLGDAGAMVARSGECIYRTASQQHEFNLPYQLGWEKVYPEGDKPSAADRVEVKLKDGDALVLGSDGLWDNVPHDEIAALCAKHDGDAEACAEAIATLAFGYSCDPEYDSPFTQEARKVSDGRFSEKDIIGGKMDDIAVVCAFFWQNRT